MRGVTHEPPDSYRRFCYRARGYLIVFRRDREPPRRTAATSPRRPQSVATSDGSVKRRDQNRECHPRTALVRTLARPGEAVSPVRVHKGTGRKRCIGRRLSLSSGDMSSTSAADRTARHALPVRSRSRWVDISARFIDLATQNAPPGATVRASMPAARFTEEFDAAIALCRAALVC